MQSRFLQSKLRELKRSATTAHTIGKVRRIVKGMVFMALRIRVALFKALLVRAQFASMSKRASSAPST